MISRKVHWEQRCTDRIQEIIKNMGQTKKPLYTQDIPQPVQSPHLRTPTDPRNRTVKENTRTQAQLTVHPQGCAHPLRPGWNSSPASHPCTGSSGRGPDAATPPCWSPQPHPQRTLFPVKTNPHSRGRIKTAASDLNTYMLRCYFEENYHGSLSAILIIYFLKIYVLSSCPYL